MVSHKERKMKLSPKHSAAVLFALFILSTAALAVQVYSFPCGLHRGKTFIRTRTFFSGGQCIAIYEHRYSDGREEMVHRIERACK